MSDSNHYDDPPMAALEGTRPDEVPPESPRSKFIIIGLLAIIAVLVLHMVRPVELDVYRGLDHLDFADPVLGACVQEFAMSNGWSDVGHIVSLRCNNPSGTPIRDLAGIEHLVELSDVNLAFNAISDAAPLAQLPALRVVDLSHNRLTSLPVFRVPANIRRLELSYNQFDTLEWLTEQNLSALQGLAVAHNHIGSVTELQATPGLKELNLRGNRVKDIGTVLGLNQLELLDLGGNGISNVEGIGALRNIRRLFLDGNALTTLDGLMALQALEELDLSGNPLVDISPIGALQRLQRLDLGNTGISTLSDILLLGDIEIIRLHGNDNLGCDVLAAAIAEFGQSAVRHDQSCTNTAEQ